MAEGNMRTVVIIGAGFSGTATAIHLLRNRAPAALRIVLIDRAPTPGRGVAYARRDYPYILNVPACRMSATPDDPDEFLRYARGRDPRVSGEDFLPRALYGDYLESTLAAAAQAAPMGKKLELLRDSVVGLHQEPARAGWRVTMAASGELFADEVVLALGNPPAPPLAIAGATHDALAGDPWTLADQEIGSGPVFVLGSGLTTVDVVCSLIAKSPAREIHVLSRHGLLPLAQTDLGTTPPDLVDLSHDLQHADSLRRIFSAIRTAGHRLNTRGGDWREVIVAARHHAPRLWQRLSDADRRRFLRHARAYWDIHRHRIPAPVLDRLNALQASGQLTIHAGRLRAIQAAADSVEVRWQPRGRSEERAMLVRRLFNCTGPDYDLTRSTDPLWRHLLAGGIAVPDGLRLGLRTDHAGNLLNRAGQPLAGLHYLGPMLRARDWECTAVAELRVHAANLADRIARATPA